jgi:tRNA(Ile)-lysidine synthase
MAEKLLSIPEVLAELVPAGSRACIAFSGGRDSSVLVHALAGIRAGRSVTLRAAHVHHGLQPGADAWQRHCEAFCAARNVPLVVLRATIRRDLGRGLEAAAREARYAALAEALEPGEWLLTAHHEDDQLETLLLHLVRGSGVTGLAAIPVSAEFSRGRLLRPLLGVAGAAIGAYAKAESLDFVQDPTNVDVALDRSYLRAEVVPRLRARWPSVARAAGRSASLAAEAACLLTDLADLDGKAHVVNGRVSLAGLRALDPARQHNLIRHLVRQKGWPPPPERRLRECLAQLVQAPPDRQPVLAWAGHEIRRYRGWLHLLDDAAGKPDPTPRVQAWDGQGSLDLGGPRGRLRLEAMTGAGLKRELMAELSVTTRAGGESVRAGGDVHHRTLKYLFQSHGVVPWMRCHVPLIHARGRLAAIGDLWVADWASAEPNAPGLRVIWDNHPDLL